MKNGIDRDMGARHAKWFVVSAKTTGWLRETELVPKTQGVVKALKEIKFAMSLVPKGKVPPPFPPHVAADIHESRQLFDLVKAQGRDGALGIVQGERALMHLEHHQSASGHGQAKHPYGPESYPLPYLPDSSPEDDPLVADLLKTAPANRSSRVVGDTPAASAAGAREESEA
jgi:hypothetical protein